MGSRKLRIRHETLWAAISNPVVMSVLFSQGSVPELRMLGLVRHSCGRQSRSRVRHKLPQPSAHNQLAFAERSAQMAKYNERPLFLLMNSPPEDDARDLPIVIYEEDIHVVRAADSSAFHHARISAQVGDQTRKEFVKAAFKIESDEVRPLPSHRRAILSCVASAG